MYKFQFISIVFTILATITLVNSATPSCNCVAFRLDDIQDYFVGAAQKAIMDVFKESSDPISVGVIALRLGQDQSIINYLKTAITTPNWDFEVVSHGYVHESFAEKNLSTQIWDLNQSRIRTCSILQGYVNESEFNIFIPPFNAYNADTITALKQTGYKMMSSLVTVDPAPYPINDGEELYRFPIGASTNDQWTAYTAPVNWQYTLSQIQDQLNTYGFSAVMMHPQEFSILDASHNPTPDVNQTMIAGLRQLIAAVKSQGIQIVTLGGIRKAFNEPADPVTTATGTKPLTTAKYSAGSTTSINNGGSPPSIETTTGKSSGSSSVTTSTPGHQSTTGSRMTSGASVITTSATKTTEKEENGSSIIEISIYLVVFCVSSVMILL